MAKVVVRDGESIEQALRRFNREVQREGILKELKRREYYEKPSAIRKREESLKKHKLELERLA